MDRDTIAKALGRNAVCVISAVIYRNEEREQVLLGVRRQTKLSRRHPGVLSTPTLRVPQSFMLAEVYRMNMMNLGRGPHPIRDSSMLGLGGSAYHQTVPESYLDLLFVRKLGVSVALTEGRLYGNAQARLLAMDDVADPLGTNANELTIMMTYELMISSGDDCFPRSTSTYSRLLWAKTKRLGEALRSHDALLVDDTLDPFEVCIHGLCVRSAVDLLDGPRS